MSSGGVSLDEVDEVFEQQYTTLEELNTLCTRIEEDRKFKAGLVGRFL